MKKQILLFVICLFAVQFSYSQTITKQVKWKFIDNNDESIQNLKIRFFCPGFMGFFNFKTNSEGLVETKLPFQVISTNSGKYDTLCKCGFDVMDDRFESFLLNLKLQVEDEEKTIVLNKMIQSELNIEKFTSLTGRISLENLISKDTLVLYELDEANFDDEQHSMKLIRIAEEKYKATFFEKVSLFETVSSYEEIDIEFIKGKIKLSVDGIQNNYFLDTYSSNNECRYVLIRER